MRWPMRRLVAGPKRQLAQRELLRIGGEAVPITLKLNRRARRLIVRVHPSTGEVTVVAPSRRELEHALDFARKEMGWIARQRAIVPAVVPLGLGARILFRGQEHRICEGKRGPSPVWIDEAGDERVIRVAGRAEHVPRRVLDFIKREARRALDARSLDFASRLGARPRRITVRDTASRWGSCSVQGSLSYSWRLILAPDFVLDYVVAHEVAHMREMNHGARFWRLVRDLVGDFEVAQKWLADHGALLHRYAPRT
jgi:predicted metal-dependent hydrolase